MKNYNIEKIEVTFEMYTSIPATIEKAIEELVVLTNPITLQASKEAIKQQIAYLDAVNKDRLNKKLVDVLFEIRKHNTRQFSIAYNNKV